MRVIVSAGGTGGHIYPALAIIKKILKEEPNSEILYIGTHNRMEKDIIPKEGIKYEAIEITGLKRSLSLSNVKTMINFYKSYKKCLKIINDFNPDVVIGAGGYVTAPVIFAAKKLGKKTFIHEQNSVVGLANKFLSKYSDKIGVSFESTLSCFDKNKSILTGNPCSEKALDLEPINKEELGLSKDKKLVLVVMGSLGSKTINEKIVTYLDSFKNKDYEVLFVTGKSFYESVKNLKVSDNVKIVPFIDNLSRVMKVTDVMISRSGASTISEITVLKVPTIFIPSPYVTNNHQYKNAMDLVNKNAALIIEEDKLTNELLINNIDSLINNNEKINNIKNNLENIGIKDSSTRIYNILKDMIINDRKFY